MTKTNSNNNSLKQYFSKAYHFVKRQFHTKFGANNDLFLIYTLSKVGSSSVYYSLKQKFPYKDIQHVHFLGATWLNKLKTDHKVFKNNLKNADRVFDLLNKKHWNIKIIALTRDPIARDVSGMFQTWQHVFDVEDITQVSAEQIISHLTATDFSYSQNWFETDFLEFTGLDVFKEGFDTHKGYQIYHTHKASILILQLEQLNTVYNEAMNAFIGKGSYVLQEENITSSRASGELHKNVKTLLKLPLERIDNIYASDYVTTFYNASQIVHFKKKWS